MLTGHFTPKEIIETLNSPVAITSINENGLKTANGKMIPVPGVSKTAIPASVATDVLQHGVEVQQDGTIHALVRIHHWCGNDPVRYHLARVDLSSLLLVVNEEHSRVSEYGIDPGAYGMATLPRQKLKEIFRQKKSEQSGPDNPIPSGTSPAGAGGMPDSRGI